MDTISVKVVRVMSSVVEVEIPAGSTVDTALQAANITPAENEQIQVGGQEATRSTVLSDGDKVILAKGAKGNA